MSFYASSFIFDGTPSEFFGMMIYDLDGHKQEDGTLGGHIKINEDRLSTRFSPLHYGTTQNEPMEFKLVFGVEEQRNSMDRFDLMAVSWWLMGHDQYKWLSICQPDLAGIRYKCFITELVPITVGGLHVAFEATITCDGPYAYHIPILDLIECTGSQEYLLRSPCNIQGLSYLPKIELDIRTGSDKLSILNTSSGDTAFTITGLEQYAPLTIQIDCANGTFTADKDIDLYSCSNLEFPTLIGGDNHITVIGNVAVSIFNEAPMNTGS